MFFVKNESSSNKNSCSWKSFNNVFSSVCFSSFGDLFFPVNLCFGCFCFLGVLFYCVDFLTFLQKFWNCIHLWNLGDVSMATSYKMFNVQCWVACCATTSLIMCISILSVQSKRSILSLFLVVSCLFVVF